MKRLFLALIPLFAVVACGGNVYNTYETGDGGGSGDGGNGGDGGTGGDGGIASGCPTSLPNNGLACTPEGLECEYGTNNGACGDPTTNCTNGVWAQPPPTPGVACLPSNACPSSPAGFQIGAVCGQNWMECNYPGQGRCTCATEGFGGPPMIDPDGGQPPNVWECEQPQQGCPVDRPRLGSACSTENQDCAYGNCAMPDSLSIGCINGVWTNQPFACAG